MDTGTSNLSQGQSPCNRAADFLGATDAMSLAGQSALWKYKAIYHEGDDRVGQWSDVVSIPVAG